MLAHRSHLAAVNATTGIAAGVLDPADAIAQVPLGRGADDVALPQSERRRQRAAHLNRAAGVNRRLARKGDGSGIAAEIPSDRFGTGLKDTDDRVRRR